MGTFAIFRMLIRHWTLTSHPIYRAEDHRMALVPASRTIRRIATRLWKPVAALSAVILLLAAADFLCGNARHPFTTALLNVCSVGGGTFILLAILAITYLWPVGVAVASSGVIAQERERQTWDVLLTTSMDWQEIVLVKLAAALRRFNPYSEMFLWGQAFLMVIIFVLVIGQFGPLNSTASLLNLPLVLITMIEFAVARAQDYVLAGLIGLLASLFAGTRQSASVIALMVALGMILIRAFITVLIVSTLPFSSIPGVLILLATGPSSVVALAWRGLLALGILLLMVAVREIAVRIMFAWLVRHLGETNAVPA